MRLGQTSVIFFVSRISSSVLGFLAMVYFARVLGAEVLGIYFLVLAVVGWLMIAGKSGVMTAVTKRVSEGREKSAYVIAGLVLVAVIFAIISPAIYLSRDLVASYLGDETFPVGLIVALFGAQLTYSYVGAVIRGDHLVHFQSILGVAQTVARIGLQLGAVVVGLGAVGLIGAQAISLVTVAGIGVLGVTTYFGRTVYVRRPERKHFARLVNYAKYSWLGRMKGSTYNMMDKLVLGAFVSTSLVGVYSICWNIASVLALFSKSLSNSFFPEMSKLSSEENLDTVATHLKEMLAFTGLFVIPGLVGAVFVGSSLLGIYGSEFRQGHEILVILVAAALVHSYHKQLVTVLNAVDRPDLSFRVNLYFVVSNVGLNVMLVYFFGWIGAAVATLASVCIAILVAYRSVARLIQFSVPYREIGRQVASAGIMGAALLGLLKLYSALQIAPGRVVPLLTSVGFGVVVYFGVLLVISGQFRTVVRDNLPFKAVM